MSGRGEDSDSDAPEEFSAQQGIGLDEEITKVRRENEARVIREEKERRKRWAEKLTPKKAQEDKKTGDAKETESHKESLVDDDLLPDEIVKQLVAREKKVFSSDSEEEQPKKKTASEKKLKKSGQGPIVVDELPPAPCLQSSLDFLKKRKMQVSRSSAVLDNSNKALRRLTTSGLL